MTAGAIHQFVPMLHRADAVGRHTMALQELLCARGVASEIFVEVDDPETAGHTRPATSYADHADPRDVVVYQFATASGLAGWLAARKETLVVNYHNVTPPELLAPWDNELARHQTRALLELGGLAERTTLAIADSEVNRSALQDFGFVTTEVVPPIVEGLPTPAEPSRGCEERPARAAGAVRWLTVGRVTPSKAIEDIMTALLAYRLHYDPGAELTVVGKSALPVYSEALVRFAAELGLSDAVRFTGVVSDQALERAYCAADVLVVASEHEGFCVPIVEAMARGLPVVAYSEGAVPEVAGDAGVLLETKDPMVVAEAVHRMVADSGWRSQHVAAGRARVASLGLPEAGPRLVDLLLAVRDRAAE